jgi:NAD(P)-dependent dehydrogenase (short-subunit alcohol dehydrogenase family)
VSVATEVEQFGIKITVVEPGFFRTDLLDARNVRWGSNVIEDYAAEGNVQEMWSAYHGTQQGDPAQLGDALVNIAGMENPPNLFVAGSDALTMIPPAIEARPQEVRAYQELSRSTDGTF